MTISTTASRISYNGNGTTVAFSFPYRFLQNADLVVIRVAANGTETTLALGTDYTVTGADDDAGGTVTCVSAPASGARLVIYRSVDITQEVDYITGDSFPAETHERALDRLTMVAQQLQDAVDRSAKLPETSTADADALVADLIRLADSADNIDIVVDNIADVNIVATNIADIQNAEENATAAASSASEAATSATNAASSASAASSSASTASTKASEASTSATNAASSASAASTSASNASSSASAASTSASNASTSATNAASSASAASTSASGASTSATNASNSATAAAGSATAAASSASAASASADAALAALDSFDDRYLGQKASDPSLDNDGNALIAGALYFNTTDDIMKVYEGSAWVAAYASLSGALIASNNLSDLSNATTARTNLGLVIGTDVQALLVSGTNIKTINSTSLLGSGDITISVPAAFPSGTAMLFAQTSAPTGWTKSTTHDNKALRVVSGTASSGGSAAFTTAFGTPSVSGSVSLSGTVGATTLTTTQMPSHNHSSYTTDVYGAFRANGTGTSPTVRGTTSNTGGGSSHDHSFSGSGSLSSATATINVAYVDVIIATKD